MFSTIDRDNQNSYSKSDQSHQTSPLPLTDAGHDTTDVGADGFDAT